jgi:hypothetical protein
MIKDSNMAYNRRNISSKSRRKKNKRDRRRD